MNNSFEGEQLFKYYEQYREVIILFLKKKKRKKWKKEIHEFRVSIKKLKGIFKLIELCNSDFDSLKYLSPYKKLFKSAGRIREAQVNLSQLKNLTDSDSYIDVYRMQQKQLIKIQKETFKQLLAKFKAEEITDGDEKVARTCHSFSRDIIVRSSEKFINERKKEIRSLIKHGTDEDSLHETRKKLKEISSIFGLLIRLDLFSEEEIKMDQLKVYEEKLGLWHDRVVLRHSLNDFIDTHHLVTPDSRLRIVLLIEKIKRLERQFTDDLKTFEKEVFDLLPSFNQKDS